MATSTSSPPAAGVTANRKADHIRINLEEDVSAKGISSGFDDYHFLHCALPEIDFDAVDTSTQLFGRHLSAPLLISCMTGGVPEAEVINTRLAETAQAYGIGLGLGSARVLLERPEVLPTFAVRKRAPDVPILANLGAVQLNKGVGVEECRRVVDLLEADALVLHLNPLQEALQPEGDTVFSGLLGKIEALCLHMDVPIVAKEIGWGISADLVVRLIDCGVAAVDVSGAGGTSWSEVERHRMRDPIRAKVASAFAGWGIPSAEALRSARSVAPDATIFASGGMRDGIDAAKAIALGADMVGIAGPFLRAAGTSDDGPSDLAEEFLAVLRTAMFAIGAVDLVALSGTPRLLPPSRAGMLTMVKQIIYETTGTNDFIDITDDVCRVVRDSGIRDGMVHISSHHTTAAIRINENEPLLIEDFQSMLERLAPAGNYNHNDLHRRQNVPEDEPLNGHAHCRHLLLSSSESLSVSRGTVRLGQWQRIFLIELDSPRTREVSVQVMGS